MVKVIDPSSNFQMINTQSNAITLMSWKGQFRVKKFRKTKIKNEAFKEKYFGFIALFAEEWNNLPEVKKENWLALGVVNGVSGKNLFKRIRNQQMFKNRYGQGNYNNLNL